MKNIYSHYQENIDQVMIFRNIIISKNIEGKIYLNLCLNKKEN